MAIVHPLDDRHHSIHFHEDQETGLKAIIAMHRCWQKPSVGGCRMFDYASTDAAISDALRLSRGMSYKSVMTGFDYGGAKAVLVGTSVGDTREGRLKAMARFVDMLGGRFRTGVDVGLTRSDVEEMRKISPNMVGLGSISPDAMTAVGVLYAVEAVAGHRLGASELAGLHVAVSGLGKVGLQLSKLLIERGARVTGADIDNARVEEARAAGVAIASPDDILSVACDIFAPCALGGVLSQSNIRQLKCAAVAGSANNQLEAPEAAEMLHAANILYAPDYIANAGGLAVAIMDVEAQDEEWAREKVRGLRSQLSEVFAYAEAAGSNTHQAAERIGSNRIAALDGLPAHD